MLFALLMAQATGVVEGGNQTSPLDKTLFSIEAIDEMRETLDELTELRDASSDELRSTCLESTRGRVEDLLEQAESASMAIIDAVAAGEDAKAEHEFRKVGVALMRTRQLNEQASVECSATRQDHEAAWQMGWSGVQPG